HASFHHISPSSACMDALQAMKLVEAYELEELRDGKMLAASEEAIVEFADLALDCIKSPGTRRPTMKDVAYRLSALIDKHCPDKEDEWESLVKEESEGNEYISSRDVFAASLGDSRRESGRSYGSQSGASLFMRIGSIAESCLAATPAHSLLPFRCSPPAPCPPPPTAPLSSSVSSLRSLVRLFCLRSSTITPVLPPRCPRSRPCCSVSLSSAAASSNAPFSFLASSPDVASHCASSASSTVSPSIATPTVQTVSQIFTEPGKRTLSPSLCEVLLALVPLDLLPPILPLPILILIILSSGGARFASSAP
ncbi:unnamed protein product, partial [Closterium sp. Naga37s-1]